MARRRRIAIPCSIIRVRSVSSSCTVRTESSTSPPPPATTVPIGARTLIRCSLRGFALLSQLITGAFKCRVLFVRININRILAHRVSIPPEWLEYSSEDILAAHEEVFDSPDPETRRQFETAEELDEYPLYNEANEEVPLYNANGERIQRREAYSPDHQWPAVGVLQDLNKLPSLFASSEYMPLPAEFDGEMDIDHGYGAGVDDDDIADNDFVEAARDYRANDVKYTGYPHCFVPNMGQWQAHGVIRPLARIVHQINRRIREHAGSGPCIAPVSSQCYNTVAHRVRRSARAHLAQTGPMTGVVTGAWASTAKTENHARRVLEFANNELPHDRLANKIEHSSPTFLRFENVFEIHPHRMNPDLFDDRNGFYNAVILPLFQACAHREVLSALKDASICLRPRVRLP